MSAEIDDVVADQYADGRRAPNDAEQIVQPAGARQANHKRRNLMMLGVAVVILVGAGVSITHLRHRATPDNPALASIQAIATSVPAAPAKPAAAPAAKPEALPTQTVVYQPSVTPLASAPAPATAPATSAPAVPATPASPATTVATSVAAPVYAPTKNPAVTAVYPPTQVATTPAPAAPARAAPEQAAPASAATVDQQAQIEALTRALAKATAEAAAAQQALANAKDAKPKVRYIVKHSPSAHLVAILKDGAVFKTESGKTVVLPVGAKVP
ncbi:MAG: hypothetical protein EPN36_14230 [Rhodanobacteraceae bacterium]|nr:MAG: hypothetical protein EPN36_14230 [Rhodanobacteraceae bacterium]